MVALRLFLRGLGHLWRRWVDKVAPPGSHRSFVGTLGVMGLAFAFALFVIACAGAFVWSVLSLGTSVQEARAVVLLVMATVFSWMSAIMIVLSAQTLLGGVLIHLWRRSFSIKPEALVTATGTFAFTIAAGCTFVDGLYDGAVLSVQAAAFLVALAFFLVFVRALRATPHAVRMLHDTGFSQLSAHQKLEVLSKKQRSTSDKT